MVAIQEKNGINVVHAAPGQGLPANDGRVDRLAVVTFRPKLAQATEGSQEPVEE